MPGATLEKEAPVIMPQEYELSGFSRTWCKLGDVQRLAWVVAREYAKISYTPSLEDLVSDFAALVRYNKAPEMVVGTRGGTKIFRYVLPEDPRFFRYTHVPHEMNRRTDPPNVPFRLSHSLSPEMFVPSEWMRDVLRAIGEKAVCVKQEDTKRLVGYSDRSCNLSKVVFVWKVQTTGR